MRELVSYLTQHSEVYMYICAYRFYPNSQDLRLREGDRFELRRSLNILFFMRHLRPDMGRRVTPGSKPDAGRVKNKAMT